MTPLELCAIAEAHFYSAAYRALGIQFARDESLWWAARPVPPFFHNAGVLRPTVSAVHVVDVLADVEGPAVVRDPFGVLDLTPYNFAHDDRETWMLRTPAPLAASPVKGLVVNRAQTPEDVMLFESSTYANIGILDRYVEGALHPAAATAKELELCLFVGLLEGRPIATALASVHPLVIGVQAVTTHSAFRRRGVARRMLTEVIAAGPDRPASLSATPLAHSLYRSLGFMDVGPGSDWVRRPDSSLGSR